MPSPTTEHEGLIQLFRHEPEFAALLLDEQADMDIPDHGKFHVGSEALTQLIAKEYRADAVVVLNDEKGPVLAIVVEVQLTRDTQKRWTWPNYLIALRTRERCHVALLVISPDAPVAAWCARPIRLGPGWELRPTVIGPEQIPIITDPEEVINAPQYALLSALAHGHTIAGDPITRALLSAVALQPENERLREYAGVVLAARPHALEILKEVRVGIKVSPDSTNPYDQFLIEFGREEGQARAILTVLATRGLDVSDDQRARIETCHDLRRLDWWLKRAVTVADTDDLFG